MTADKFRSLALSFPGAIESAHVGHPDFRVEGKIFASLGYPDDEFGMVALTPMQQRDALKSTPDIFTPCSGMWGRRGATQVHLEAAKVAVIRSALGLAWQNATLKMKRKS